MAKPNKNIVYYVLSLLYGNVTEIRNRMFDKGILKSKSFDVPVISVGNLAVGGTGKTPHTEFLLQNLSNKFKMAVLSRGYRRTTKGFVLADKNSSAATIGDESFQIYSKFPNVTVAVDEKRAHGIEEILKLKTDTELIILDDAFQHRYVKPGLSILLTDYSNLYVNDSMMPYGNLREWKSNSRRADFVLVTKCPPETQNSDFKIIKQKLSLKQHQKLFFSAFEYGEIYPVFGKNGEITEIDAETTVFLLTGIVKPQPMADYLLNFTEKTMPYFFPDHHDFTPNELEEMDRHFEKIKGKKLILTTEKDAARLKSIDFLSERIKENLFALPLEVKILNNEQDIFIQKIENYVRENSRNR